MPDQAPPPGLYQQLLTEGLEQQLRDLQDTLVAWPDRNDPLAHPPTSSIPHRSSPPPTSACGSASPSACA